MTSRIEKSPFSLYDFMGYIIPGIIFLSFMALSYLSIGDESDMYHFLRTHLYPKLITPKTSSFVYDIGMIGFLTFFGLSAFYIMGHFIATLSHLTIDRVIVYSLLKYPILTNFDLVEKEDRDYPVMLFNLTLLLIVVGIFALLAVNYVKNQNVLVEHAIKLFYLLIASSAVRVILPVLIGLLPRKDKRMSMNPEWRLFKLLERIYRLLEGVTISPMLSALFMNKRFDDGFKTRVIERFKEVFGLDPIKEKTNVYWLMHYYVIRRSSKLEAYQTNWHRLYGLCRNVSFACFMIVVLQIYLCTKYSNVLCSAPGPQISILCITLSTVFLFRYLVLYSNYYTKNLVRSFFILSSIDPDSSEKSESYEVPSSYL